MTDSSEQQVEHLAAELAELKAQVADLEEWVAEDVLGDRIYDFRERIKARAAARRESESERPPCEFNLGETVWWESQYGGFMSGEVVDIIDNWLGIRDKICRVRAADCHPDRRVTDRRKE